MLGLLPGLGNPQIPQSAFPAVISSAGASGSLRAEIRAVQAVAAASEGRDGRGKAAGRYETDERFADQGLGEWPRPTPRELRFLPAPTERATIPFVLGGSNNFMAQLFAQSEPSDSSGVLLQHRDGPALSSEAYRRAGADPIFYNQEPALFRLAV